MAIAQVAPSAVTMARHRLGHEERMEPISRRCQTGSRRRARSVPEDAGELFQEESMTPTAMREQERSSVMTLAPLEYMVIRMEDGQFNREILPVLATMQQAGSVRAIDVLFVTKDAEGKVTTREVQEIGEEDLQQYGKLVDDLQGLLTTDDIATLAADLPPMESAVIVLLEHCWTQGLVEAVGRAGGTLVTAGLVAPDALARVNHELAAVPA
jgi:hypothetical protein